MGMMFRLLVWSVDWRERPKLESLGYYGTRREAEVQAEWAAKRPEVERVEVVRVVQTVQEDRSEPSKGD